MNGSSPNDDHLPFDSAVAKQTNTGLSSLQTVAASLLLVSWLFLFAGGITMDTTQFRCAISSGGALKLATEARPGDEEAKSICKQHESWAPVWTSSFSGETGRTYRLVVAWFGLLLFFLPLNLAMVSAAAGGLGALGNKANLEDDPMDQASTNLSASDRVQSQDNTSPIMSGLLRGLFVYLFFISGLLLFDDKPFSSPGPGLYIRLAGFISLISFLVNYRPHLFATISDWAFDRINSRKVVPTRARQEETKITVEERSGSEAMKTASTNGKPGTNGDKLTETMKASLPSSG